MNNQMYRRQKRKTYLEKSSSEPDLKDHSPARRNLPFECITVDELKFYRRRKPPDFYTKSNFCLYDHTEPIVPFSELKTEYEDEYGHLDLIPRSLLRRRSTSLKLDGLMEVGRTEHQSMYRPYLDDELESCRQTSAKFPDNLTTIQGSDSNLAQRTFATDQNMEIRQQTRNEAHDCHLKLEGELSYMPEYRSQFVPYPIERSHSIPQISNIKFHGKFSGIPEYTASFKSYDNIAKRGMIRNPDLIGVKGTIDGIAVYQQNFQEPDKNKMEKSISAKTNDGFSLQQDFSKHIPEYNDRFKDPKITSMPERPKPRTSILELKGNMEYNPEYRSTYLNFPRSRPITKKPPVNLNIFDSALRRMPSPPKKFESKALPKQIHHVTTADDPLNNLPFMCQPEVRKAKKEILIKERSPTRDQPLHQDLDIFEQNIIGLPAAEKTDKSENVERNVSPVARQQSPSFKLMVQNVDDPGGTFRKTIPKFGRRASHAVSEAHRLRNRTRVIEGNRKYCDAKETKDHKNRRNTDQAPSFIVLNEPCKQSKWMKPSWYDP